MDENSTATALNPKTTLFVISTYTQIVSLTTPKTILLAYGFFIIK
jgi:threonine/homoserine/homoserine lactone efflux protein